MVTKTNLSHIYQMYGGEKTNNALDIIQNITPSEDILIELGEIARSLPSHNHMANMMKDIESAFLNVEARIPVQGCEKQSNQLLNIGLSFITINLSIDVSDEDTLDAAGRIKIPPRVVNECYMELCKITDDYTYLDCNLKDSMSTVIPLLIPVQHMIGSQGLLRSNQLLNIFIKDIQESGSKSLIIEHYKKLDWTTEPLDFTQHDQNIAVIPVITITDTNKSKLAMYECINNNYLAKIASNVSDPTIKHQKHNLTKEVKFINRASQLFEDTYNLNGEFKFKITALPPTPLYNLPIANEISSVSTSHAYNLSKQTNFDFYEFEADEIFTTNEATHEGSSLTTFFNLYKFQSIDKSTEKTVFNALTFRTISYSTNPLYAQCELDISNEFIQNAFSFSLREDFT